jgi:hypothetical protein
MKKEKKPVGRPRGPMTALQARKEIDALKSLLDDGDIDMKQFHSLKDTILAKLVGGEQ